MWIWILLGLIAAIVIVFASFTFLGSRLPIEHVATLTLRLNRKPLLVWDVISNVAGYRNWAAGVTKLERLPDHDNHEVWRQHMGRNSFVLETTEFQPPVRMVRTIADDHKHFSGSWEYVLTPDGEGTRLTLTERGRVNNPFARAMMSYMKMETYYLRKHLVSLAGKFGEVARIEQKT